MLGDKACLTDEVSVQFQLCYFIYIYQEYTVNDVKEGQKIGKNYSMVIVCIYQKYLKNNVAKLKLLPWSLKYTIF